MSNNNQILFDVNRSLKECKPKYPKGVNHTIRKLIQLKDIVHSEKKGELNGKKGASLNIRVYNHLRANVLKLVDSFQNLGWVYAEPPLVVELGEDGRYYLKAGFNRLEALTELEQTMVLVDVVTFDTPANEIMFMIQSNECHLPSQDNDDKDYVKALKKLVAQGSCTRDNTSYLKVRLKDMTPTKSPAQRTAIFNKFRSSLSAFENVVDVDAKVANDILDENGFPSKGFVLDLQQIGFARPNGDFGTKIKQMIDLYDTYLVPVQIYGYILNVDPSKIADQRSNWMDSFDRTMLWVTQHLNKKYHHIFEFRGFIGQITTADPLNVGLPLEDVVVNLDGSPV